jgi:hypothetical protein
MSDKKKKEQKKHKKKKKSLSSNMIMSDQAREREADGGGREGCRVQGTGCRV